MKKIIFLLCILSCCIGSAHGVYYNNNNVNCSGTLSNTDGIKMIPTPNNYNSPSSGNLNCISSGYYGGVWSGWLSRGSHYACPDNGYAVYIQNSGSSYRVYCKYRDNVPPTVADISNTNPVHISATNSYPYGISVSNNGGAPIVLVEGYVEDINNPSGQVAFSYSGGSFTYNWNISLVDNYRESNGSRQYSFTVTRICDQAGNCWNGTQRYDHNVYANASDIDPVSSQVTTSTNFTSGNTADGSTQLLQLQIKDIYGNDVIPTSSINRTVATQFDANNSLYLDQYNQSGSSSVFISTATSYNAYPIGDNALYNVSNLSSDGSDQYNFNLKLYTPTANSLGDATRWNGSFLLNDISVTMNDTISGTQTASLDQSNIDFNFVPRYATLFDNLGIKQYGLAVDGGIQDSQFDLVSNAGVTPSNPVLYITYGGDINNLNMQFAETGSPATQVSETGLDAASVLTWNLSNNRPLRTLLESSDTVSSSLSTYLGTHISYQIPAPSPLPGNLDITYHGEIIGDYDGSLSVANTFNSGLRVVGNIHSQTQKNITTQQTDSLSSLGNISKPLLGGDIKKNVYELIKDAQYQPSFHGNSIGNLTGNWSAGGANSFDGTQVLENGSILYYNDLSGGNVEITGSENLPISGQKTLIVIGGNLYLRSNTYYQSSSDMLGIIVLADDAGNGGNLYIDPSITNIAATIYAEGSLISYDGTQELSGAVDQQLLTNQLHIYGSVFSENTIGGSVRSSGAGLFTCPFNITEGTCTKDVAQKYDLNYLRRYQTYEVDQDGDPLTTYDIFDIPSYNGKVMGNGVCSWNAGTGYYSCNSSSLFTPHSITTIYPSGDSRNSSYLEYPVIIQYNPRVQINPPPLFGE